jgi:hypothetical protein
VVNLESPRSSAFDGEGLFCICELTNHVPEIHQLHCRLERGAVVLLSEHIKPGGPINRKRVVEMVQERSQTLGQRWQGDQLEKNVDLTLQAFESQWGSALCKAQNDLRSMWDCTREVIAWVGGVRIWEESRRMAISLDDSKTALRARLVPYRLITSHFLNMARKVHKISPEDLTMYKTRVCLLSLVSRTNVRIVSDTYLFACHNHTGGCSDGAARLPNSSRKLRYSRTSDGTLSRCGENERSTSSYQARWC